MKRDESEMDEVLECAIRDIANNHRKIIDDWCKAYLAQLYEEGVEIKPGCFTLCEQVPTFHKGKDCMEKKYWFEEGRPFYNSEDSEGWIKINPLPIHDEECQITLKNGKIIQKSFYDAVDREFYEIREGNHYFHDLKSVDSWKKGKR